MKWDFVPFSRIGDAQFGDSESTLSRLFGKPVHRSIETYSKRKLLDFECDELGVALEHDKLISATLARTKEVQFVMDGTDYFNLTKERCLSDLIESHKNYIFDYGDFFFPSIGLLLSGFLDDPETSSHIYVEVMSNSASEYYERFLTSTKKQI